MRITVDTAVDGPNRLREAAAIIMTLAEETELTRGTPPASLSSPPPPLPPQIPPAPPAPPAPAALPVPPLPSSPSQNSTAAPTAAVAPAPNNTSAAVELDKSGIPWDARIHQKAKSKKKDGTWKILKGADPAQVEAVIKELSAQRHVALQPVTVVHNPAPPTMTPEIAARIAALDTPAPPASVPLPPALPVQEQPVPPVPASAGTPPVPAAPVAAAGITRNPFRELVEKVTNATIAKKITPEAVKKIVTDNGAPSLQALATMQHLIENIDAAVDLAIAKATAG